MATLRDLPAVDTLLTDPALAAVVAAYGPVSVRDAVRDAQHQVRTSARDGGVVDDAATTAAFYASAVHDALRSLAYTPVFNLTGTIVHTNLGRALLSESLWRETEALVTRPMNLEYNLAEGARGDRDAVLERQLAELIGCEAATIVNNNAAALLLVLNTFALGQKVPVSRGELIEIGGSFRLPELMTRAGCELVEVGTTNRTHLKDYEAALPEAAMLLKVHPSNFHIEGFTKEVSSRDLAVLAHDAGLPSCVDLGSGTLVDLTQWGLPPEPTPQAVLKEGIDIVTFSGDKLLGGVQAGLIVGRRDLLAAIKKNPLKRALRADKITLALLSATLKRYQHPETLPEEVPLLATLTCSETVLRQRGEALLESLPAPWTGELVATEVQIGSGALPDKTVPSLALRLAHPALTARKIQNRLRALPVPVIGRVAEDRVWLDLHGAEPLPELVNLLSTLS